MYSSRVVFQTVAALKIVAAHDRCPAAQNGFHMLIPEFHATAYPQCVWCGFILWGCKLIREEPDYTDL
ncbi:MAG TPA: hypothetical protein VFH56_02915 [Acidimicrobiales bacterium]|nr:hypothetical protein [Acidimicrobiales bacterium]